MCDCGNLTVANDCMLGGGGGGGGITGATNIGNLGVGPFAGLNGTVLNFYNIAPSDPAISVHLDGVNGNILIDFVPSEVNINDFAGVLGVLHGGTGLASLTAGNFLIGNGVGPVNTSKVAPTGDVVGTSDSQVLTNKDLTDTTDNIIARGLWNSSGIVSTYASPAPAGAGYLLVTTSATTATWQAAGAFGVSNAANIGTLGIGPFAAKVGSVLDFNNIAPGSSKISIVLDLNNNILIDAVEANFVLNNLSGILDVSHGGTGLGTLPSGFFLTGNGTSPVLVSKAVPSGVVVGDTDSQSLTNKTLTDSSDNVIARALWYGSGAASVSTYASTAPVAGDFLVATSAVTATWQSAVIAGLVTGAANIGTLGVGPFVSKAGSVLDFNNIAPGSSKISVVLDLNNNILIDAVEANFVLNNLSGILNVSHGGTGLGTLPIGFFLTGNGTSSVLVSKAVPSGVVVGDTDSQSLTNKTLTDATDNVLARGLWYGTGAASVSTYASSAPAVGNVLVATSAVTATWQPVSSSGAITSVSGTANQVGATTVSGAVTVFTPNVFIAPGTIQDTTGLYFSTTTGISAAGATQSTATGLTTSYNVVSTVSIGTGVRLAPPAVGGLVCVIVNLGANTLNVYPATGDQIDSAGANAAVQIGSGATATYQAAGIHQWYTVDPEIVAGVGVSVVYGNGETTISNTGVLTTVGTANQVSASPTSGNVVVSLPATVVAPGTIQDTTGMYYSTTNGIAAAGATQATATGLTTSFNVVTTAPGSGVRLSVPTTGGLITTIVNRSASTISVYPAVGGQIDAAGVNNSVSLLSGGSAIYQATSTSQWYTVDPELVAGSGITITYSNGQTIVSNAGVVSVTGTANQVTASPTSGNVIVSLPTTLVAPGTIRDTSGMYFSTTTGIAAAGSNQGTATPLTTSYNIIISVPAGSGVLLPTPAIGGLIVEIVNASATTLKVYPSAGSQIDSAGSNVPVLLPANGCATYQAASTSQWYAVDPVMVAGSGISVVYSNGQATVSNAGATSVTGTAFQISASPTTGAVVLTIPTTFVAPGNLQDTTGAYLSTTVGISAAGATQGTATLLTTSFNVVTTTPVGTGVQLPAPVKGGLICNIVNVGANPLNIYPAPGAQIDGLGVNNPIVLPIAATSVLHAATPSQWLQIKPSLTAGPGIGLVFGPGSLTISNTGVLSATGTANQVTVSPTTGNAVVSLPNTLIAPGTIKDTTGMYYSTTNGITSTGTNQSGATLLTTSYNIIQVAPAGTGVRLPVPASSGLIMTIVNEDAVNSLNIYPAVGGQIDDIGVNIPITVPAESTTIIQAEHATLWHVIVPVIVGGSGISVLYEDGIVTLASTGAVSVTGTPFEINASPTSGAVVLSTPTTFVAPGTIQDTTGLYYSTTDGITAAGTNQAGATPLTTSYNIVTTTPSGSGVRLQAPTKPGLICTIVNVGINSLNVYPNVGAEINFGGANLPIVMPINDATVLQASSTLEWISIRPAILAGPGISVGFGLGSVTINNTGTTSVTGTAQQISASPTSGAVVLSTPFAFVAPGSIQDTTGMYFSTTSGISAAGTSQGTATLLTTSYNVVTSVSVDQGVRLQVPVGAGLFVEVVNRGAAVLNVYPNAGGQIDLAGINLPVMIPVGGSATYQATTTSQWHTVDPVVAAGTGMSVSYGDGEILLNNTGAVSVTGTINQVSASPTSGAVVLTIPNNFVAPGTIQDTTGLYYSTTAGIAAAGATQGTATLLTTSFNVVSTASAGQGIRLQVPTKAGLIVEINNDSATTINVYPNVGGQIDSAGTNVAVTMLPRGTATYQASSTLQWHTIVPPVTSGGTGLSVVYGNGTTTLTNTGVLSVTGTSNQVAASPTTGAVVLSTPVAFIAPGTIQDTTGMYFSTTNAITAVGGGQGAATLLTTSFNIVTSATGGAGVRLQAPGVAGLIVEIVNKSTFPINVYPQSGGQIDSAGTDIAVSLAIGASSTYQAATVGQWYTVDPEIVGGTGITVSYGNGQTTISNSGALSVTGTANQVTASPTSGAIVVSTPATFIAPGTIQDTTGMYYSTTNGILAAGATQGTATLLITSYNIVTTVAAGTGVRLSVPATGGLRVVVVNRGANTLNVYPAVGGQIDAAGVNVAVTLPAGGTVTYEAATATQWYTVDPVLVAGAGTTITYGNGQTTISSTGSVTSVTGTANQVTASPTSGAVVVSTPATFVAPGTIQDTTGMYYSTTNGISATGATQGTATLLITSYNIVTTVTVGTGVRLSVPATSGLRVVVVNKGANTLNVYPASGGAIDSAGANVAVTLPAGGTVTYEAASTTQWYTVDPVLVAGAGTSVTYGNGQTTVTNTGTTSVTGTANQVSASPTSGAVVVSTPSTFVAPGTIQDTTGMYYSTTTGISAAGASQGTATPLTTSYNIVTVVGVGQGVQLPTPTVGGLRLVIINNDANTLNVYPAVGGTIDSAGINNPVTLPVGGTVTYEAATTTQWYTVKPVLVAGAGISVTYGNGQTTISSTSSVTSVTGTTNQATVSPTTGAVVVSTPATFIAPGTIQDTTGLYYSTTNAISAAGANQAAATALTTSYNIVTTVTAGTGVRLSVPTTGGLQVVVVNKGANTLNVYPAVGGQIDAAGANIAVTIPAGVTATYQAATTTQWYTIDPVLVAGSGVTVTYGNGQTTVANTGVLSVTGTANQVSAAPTSGAVVVSTPSTFIAPGTIQDTTGMFYSTTTSIAAAGSTQGTATLLTTSYNIVTTVAAGTGVRLPTPTVAGLRIVVVHKGASLLAVYPATGGVIDAAGINASVTVPVGGTVTYEAGTTTQWYTVDPVLAAGTGVSVTFGNGRTTIANTGATRVTGTTNQITASPTTGAVVVSIPATFIAPGTIRDTTGMYYSTTTNIAAAGATQGTATLLTTSYNIVTTVTAGTGVRLGTPAAAGLRVVIVNQGANTLNVYPASGAAVDGAGTNNPVTIPAGGTATYEAATTILWYTVGPPIVAGNGVSVTYAAGQTTVAASSGVSHANFWSTVAVAITTTTAVGFESADASNTADITKSANTNSIITLTNAGTYVIEWGIWNTVATSASYQMTLNGTSTVIPNSVISAQGSNNISTNRFIRTFSASDTIRIIATATLTNTAPGGTNSLSAFLTIVRIA